MIAQLEIMVWTARAHTKIERQQPWPETSLRMVCGLWLDVSKLLKQVTGCSGCPVYHVKAVWLSSPFFV